VSGVNPIHWGNRLVEVVVVPRGGKDITRRVGERVSCSVQGCSIVSSGESPPPTLGVCIFILGLLELRWQKY